MDNALLALIDQRFQKNINESSLINTTTCIVLDASDDTKCKVRMLANDSIYTIPNLSGSAVSEGDICQVYYKTSLSQRNCYIGAALNKQGSGNTIAECINFDERLTLPSIDYVAIANCKIKCLADSPSLLNVVMNVQGLSQTELDIQVVVNGENHNTLQKTVEEDSKEVVSFSLPLFLSKNQKYKIELKAKGMVDVLSADWFVYGFNIETTTIFDPTTDSDYIYDTNNTSIIYYIGNSNSPQIPTTLQDTNVTKIYATGFNYSNIEAVYIPEGITEIE